MESNALVKALKVSMQVQAMTGPSAPVQTQNAFEALMDDDNDLNKSIAEDNEVTGNTDDVEADNNNTGVSSYMTSSLRPSRSILATCKKVTSVVPPEYTVVDSGATVHMNNDSHPL